METRLFDAELKVMGVLWREGEATAKHIADVLAEEVGWNRNTTYTLIKRCIQKGAVERLEPHFRCRALVAREAVQAAQTDELVSKLFASLLGRRKLSGEEIARLRTLVDEWEGDEGDEPA